MFTFFGCGGPAAGPKSTVSRSGSTSVNGGVDSVKTARTSRTAANGSSPHTPANPAPGVSVPMLDGHIGAAARRGRSF
jgi:hypothetical protein